MNWKFRILLLLEIVGCFGPVLLLALLGFAFSPMFIASFISDGEFTAFLMVVLPIFGILGLVGAVSLAVKVMDPERSSISPLKIKIMAVCGVLSVCVYFVLSVIHEFTWYNLILVLPLLSGIHLLYLGRSYLCNGAAQC